ncbi:MAG: kelch repeat-containing protein [Phycisphaerae bacterium]
MRPRRPPSMLIPVICLVSVWCVGGLTGCVSSAPANPGGGDPTGAADQGAQIDDPPNTGGTDTTGDDQADQDSASGDDTSQKPAPRGGAPAVWMPTAQKLVLFGGMSPITDDTFTYDPLTETWTEPTPQDNGPLPAPRCHHAFLGIPGSDAGILFGGFSFAGRFNDAWRYDVDTNTWTQLTPTGTTPSRRCLHAAVFIGNTQRMLMYGGIFGGGTRSEDFFDDTHILDLTTNTWTRIDAVGPGKLEGPVLFHASADDAVYLWGGKQVDHYPTTLWRFDVGNQQWQSIETAGDTPIGREDPTWFWDDARNTLTIFTGRNDDTRQILLDDGCQLDLDSLTWTAIDASAAPAPRWRASVVFDPVADRGIMFGGWEDFGGSAAFNDTWHYQPNPNTWTRADAD